MTDRSGSKPPTETTRLLQQSVRISRENEDIAERTIEEVLEQGNKLDGAYEQVNHIKDITTAARASVKAIQAKFFNRKVQLWAIIVVLFLVNLGLVARMYNNGGSLYGRSR